MTIELSAQAGIADSSAESPRVPTATDALGAVAWLVWPTDGLDPPLEAGAFRVLSASSEVVAESAGRGTLAWTVTVKLTDVAELRRLATRRTRRKRG